MALARSVSRQRKKTDANQRNTAAIGACFFDREAVSRKSCLIDFDDVSGCLP